MKHMKKLVWVLLILLALACFAACDDPSDSEDPGNNRDPEGNAEESITITYYLDAGQSPITVNVSRGFTLSPIPTKEGYEFLGLYDAPSGGSCIVDANGNAAVSFTKSVTLYAQWKTKTYKFSFDPLDGSLSRREQSVVMGSTVTLLPVPELKGYDFVGWQDRFGNMISNGANVLEFYRVFDAEHYTPEGDSVKLTAVYAQRSITVTLDLRDGTYETQTIQLTYGQVLELASLPDRDTGSRRIVAWSIFANSTVAYTDRAVEEDLILYAVWKDYNTFLMDDGLGNQTSVKVYRDEPLELSRYDGVVRPGYRVVGWYTNPGLTGTAQSYISYGSTQQVYYAQWAPTSYTLTFDTASAGKEIGSIVYTMGSVIGLETLYKEGYTFNGWCTTPDCSDQPFTSVNSDFWGDHTLYAKFTPDAYTVKLNPGKGTVSESTAEVSYQSPFLLPVPKRAGAGFLGWYYLDGETEVLCTDETGKSIMNYPFMEGKNLYAKWKTVTLTVKYDTNGGGTIEAQQYEYGATLRFPAAPTKTNLYFMGWYHGDLREAYSEQDEVNSNLTLYARWGDVDRAEVYSKCDYTSILDGASSYNGNYYKIFNISCSWDMAKRYCEAMGGHLVTITSIGEDAVCGRIYRESGLSACYIGATDRDLEGVWSWVTGEKWGYSNFGSGEPNGGTGSNFGAYYSIVGQTAYWDDTSGDHIFMCEWEEGDVAWVRENVGFLKSADTLYNDALYFAGHTYKIYNYSGYNHKQQVNYCEALGGHMATLENQRENDIVAFLLRYSKVEQAMIGANDVGKEGSFEWADGRPIQFSQWNNGEPNNSSSKEHYVEFYHNGGWNDVSDGARTAFICEWDYWQK